MNILDRLFGSSKKAKIGNTSVDVSREATATPLPDHKIKSLVEEYLSLLQGIVWSNEIGRIEKEITAQAEKALPVIEQTLESRVAIGPYQTLQSNNTMLVGLIAKINAPETVHLLCRIAKRENASPDYVHLITRTCITSLAELAANGREDAKQARDSLAMEFPSLIPSINEDFSKNTNIPPIEINSTSLASHPWMEHCNPKTPKNIVSAFTKFGDASGKGEAWDFEGLSEFISTLSPEDQRYVYWNIGASGVNRSGIPSKRCYIRAIQVYPMTDNLGRMLESMIKEYTAADFIQKLDEPLRQRIKKFVEQREVTAVNGQFDPQLITDLVAAWGVLK